MVVLFLIWLFIAFYAVAGICGLVGKLGGVFYRNLVDTRESVSMARASSWDTSPYPQRPARRQPRDGRWAVSHVD